MTLIIVFKQDLLDGLDCFIRHQADAILAVSFPLSTEQAGNCQKHLIRKIMPALTIVIASLRGIPAEI
jgi:hypothetical protein